MDRETNRETNPEMIPESDHDMYGTPRQVAVNQLNEFLHETLREPEAQLEDVHLEDGRWQSRVQGSKRRIAAVFLLEHDGVLAPGHMTEDFNYDTPSKW